MWEAETVKRSDEGEAVVMPCGQFGAVEINNIESDGAHANDAGQAVGIGTVMTR